MASMGFQQKVLQHLGTVLEKDRADRVREKMAAKAPMAGDPMDAEPKVEGEIKFSAEDKDGLEAAGNDAFVKARHNVAAKNMAPSEEEEGLIEFSDDDKDSLTDNIKSALGQAVSGVDDGEETVGDKVASFTDKVATNEEKKKRSGGSSGMGGNILKNFL